MTDLRLTECFQNPKIFFLLPFPLSQFLYNLLIPVCMKQFSENRFLIFGFCPQQFHKFSLCDHRDLHELLPGKPHDLFYLFLCFFLRIFCPVRHPEGQRRRYIHHALSALFGTDVLWDPANGVFGLTLPFFFQKHKFYKRLCLRICILTLKFCALFSVHHRTCLSVNCKNHCVKDRRLSCSRVTRNQKQILIRYRKINDRLLSIRTEGLHGKSHRFHASTSPV